MLIQQATFSRLCRARDQLHALEPVSIHGLAEQLGLSPFHFIRQFHALFGRTPHQLRIEARIVRAKELLELDRAVTAVCLEVGFSSVGSFSSTFTRRVGASPSVYRRNARRIWQVPGRRTSPHPFGCFDLLALLPASAFGAGLQDSHLQPLHGLAST
jgi:AraC-like DNA-binding protein